MRVFFQLYRRYADIAAAEAVAVTKAKQAVRLDGEFLVANVPHARFERIALSHAVFEHFFTTAPRMLISAIKRFAWKKHCRGSFRVTVHHSTDAMQHDIAGHVASFLPRLRVDLKNPQSDINFFFVKDKVIAGKLLWKSTECFEGRKVHKWPAPHPTGTHPRLARAMINLTGIERGEIIDPFCGAGGILIEAGLMGLRPVGSDIDSHVLVKASKNLVGYGISNASLSVRDARTMKPADFVVADLPYGRNTPKIGLEELYADFLKALKKTLKGRAVLGFPSTINYKPLIRKSKLKLINEFDWYINKHLSKQIVVMENPQRMQNNY